MTLIHMQTRSTTGRISPRGFTLMELIVAVALSAMMLFLISQVFNATSQAIGRGVGVGDIVTNSKTVASQLLVDAKEMVGPHDNFGNLAAAPNIGDNAGGFLVIINERMLATRLDGPNNTVITRPIRSDQLIFIRRRVAGESQISPSNTSDFAAQSDDGRARYVKVWYGHVKRTAPDGTVEMISGVPTLIGNTGSNDRDANRWILGRQALFLGEEPALPPTPDVPPFPIYAEGGTRTSTVVGYSAGDPTDGQLYLGGTDYAYVSFDNPLHTFGSLVGNSAGAVLQASTGAAYGPTAINSFGYAGVNRLRVNPQPDRTVNDLEAWQIAQMHPYLMEYVSDFAIEWAGDVDLNGGIDKLTAADAVATDAAGNTYDLTQGSIKWYTTERFANYGAGFNPSMPAAFPVPTTITPAYAPREDPNTTDEFGAFVWRHDDEAMADGFGKHTGDPIATPGDNQQPSFWPYLIRVRWKMHDPRGQIQSGAAHPWPTDDIDNDADGVVDEDLLDDREVDSGMWFEQVIQVRRPAAVPYIAP